MAMSTTDEDSVDNIIHQLTSEPDLTKVERLIAALQVVKSRLENSDAHSQESEQLWSSVARGAEIIANALRNENNRTPIGNLPTIQLFVSFIQLNASSKTSLIDVDIQSLRVLANICFDNDQNRKMVLEFGGVDAVITCLQKSLPQNIDIIKTAAGTLVNLGLGFEPIQVECAKSGAIPVLCRLLDPETFSSPDIPNDVANMTATWAARALENILATKEGKKAFPTDASGISCYIRLITFHTSSKTNLTSNEEILDSIFEPLESIVLDSEDLQVSVYNAGLLTPLMDFVEYSSPPLNSTSEFEKKYAGWKAAMVRVIVGVFSSDKNMNPLFHDKIIFDRLLRWLAMGSERDDLQICAALAFGNMARTDVHCIDLVSKHSIVPILVDILKQTEDYKVQHAVVGILKNLAVPSQNKRVLGNEGVIEIVAPLLELDTIKPLQFGVVGVIKHLCVANIPNSIRLVGSEKSSKDTPLTRLLSLLKRTDEVPVKSEGARVLVNAVKSIWSYNPSPLGPPTPISTSQSTSSQSECEIDLEKIKSRLSQSDVVIPLANMIQSSSKYPVLQNEGAIALTLLVMQDTSSVNPVLELLYASLLVAEPTVKLGVESELDTSSTPSLSSLSPTPAISVTGTDLKNQPVRTHSMDVREKEKTSPEPSNVDTLESNSCLLDTIIGIIKNTKYPPEIRSNMCVLLRKAIETSTNSGFKAFIHRSLANVNTEPVMVRGAIERVLEFINI